MCVCERERERGGGMLSIGQYVWQDIQIVQALLLWESILHYTQYYTILSDMKINPAAATYPIAIYST